ncbi:MAG: hydroxyacid aldolase [Methylobacteriaceae bacterium]|nr:hydroxyacid aldolase [Methylobacteriaceae bacterium]
MLTMTEVVASLARRLSAGETLLLGWSGIPDPAVPELMTRAGFDAAALDMQHGAWTYASALSGISAVASAGKPCLVRIPVDEFPTVSRLLDAGAAGVIAPMINSAADARAFAAFAKLPPLGERSWGPARALGLTGLSADAYLARANGIHQAIAMVETREAMAALDDILDTPGIDGVLVGPSDLSIALSNGAKLDADGAEVDSALTHIAAACRKRGKTAAVFCHSGARARELVRRGYNLLSVGNDQILLRQAAVAEMAVARG